MAKAKADERAAIAADRAPTPIAQPESASTGNLARRAYDLYLARGCEHGHDVDDWLQAERELRGTSTSAAE